MPDKQIIVFAEESHLRWTDGRGVERETIHRLPVTYAHASDGNEITSRDGCAIAFAFVPEDVPRYFAADLGGRLVESREEYEAERDRRAKADRN